MTDSLHSRRLDDHGAELRADPLAFSSARHLPWKNVAVATAAVGLVCAAMMVWVDRPVALYFKALNDTPLDQFFRAITQAGQSAIWYFAAAVGFFVCWRKSLAAPDQSHDKIVLFQWRRRARSFVFVIVSMLTSGTLINLLKLMFGRYRPRYLFEDGIYGFAPFMLDLKSSGFPSGHTQSIVAAMAAFGMIWPRWRYPLWAFAALVGASRFVITVHYTADVIAGAFIAVTIAVIIRALFERQGLAVAWSSRPNGSR